MFPLLLTTSTFHNTVQRMVEIIAMMAVSLMSRNNSLIKDSNGRRTKNITVDEIIYEDNFLKIFLWKYLIIGYRVIDIIHIFHFQPGIALHCGPNT